MKKPILLIDDEQNCFEIIRAYINMKKPDIPVYFAPHAEYAVEYMKAQMRNKKGISAIICDNHLSNPDNPDTIDGDEFLRTIRGYPNAPDMSRIRRLDDIKDTKIRKFISENFMDFGEYQQISDFYFNGDEPLLIMICGAPDEVNTAGIGDVPLYIKSLGGCKKLAQKILEDI